MLETIDLDKQLGKKEYKEKIKELEKTLARQQRECQDRKVPVAIVFEGLGASGKGTLINQLIQPLDPRGFRVFAVGEESREEKRRPFLWRFWTKIPAKGRIAVFNRSWYRRVLVDRFDKKTSKKQLGDAYQEIVSFEKQLTDDGMVILKFFLLISKKEQKTRFERLLSREETSWRVSDSDRLRNKEYDRYLRMNDEMLEKTDTEFAPWHIIEAENKEFAAVKIARIVVECLAGCLAAESAEVSVKLPEIEVEDQLAGVDLGKTLDKKEYKEELEGLQKRLSLLHSELYRKKVPVAIVFEGWDASGKGGAIKRLTEAMDPRGYAVYPTAAPNDQERAHHYLWRFWNTVPASGHISIYDRSWYGRLMVERVEGFATAAEWKRAYYEINQMEEHFTNFGMIVLKFWMQIDKEEQENRFKARLDDPDKNWKITDEDWRNREKWDEYEKAVNEMLLRTSTTYAPWTVVPGNSKYYARIAVLKQVIAALEKRL